MGGRPLRVLCHAPDLLAEVGRDVEPEIEGLTVAADGQVYAITDNDNDRPTLLLRLGAAKDLFRS